MHVSINSMSMHMHISTTPAHATSLVNISAFSHCRRIPRNFPTDVSRGWYHRWIAIVIETVVDIVFLLLCLNCCHCNGHFASLRLLLCNRPLQIDKVQGLQRRELRIPHYLVLGMMDGIVHDCVGAADAAGAVGDDFDVLGDTDSDRSRSCSQLAHCHLQQIQARLQFHEYVHTPAAEMWNVHVMARNMGTQSC